MITEEDLNRAIAECQGQRHPTDNTCVKLAAYLTIKDKLYSKEEPSYSYEERPIRRYKSETEFFKIAEKTDSEHMMAVMDQLMDILKSTQPRLYDRVISRMRL